MIRERRTRAAGRSPSSERPALLPSPLGQTASRRAHNPEIAGPTPAAATTPAEALVEAWDERDERYLRRCHSRTLAPLTEAEAGAVKAWRGMEVAALPAMGRAVAWTALQGWAPPTFAAMEREAILRRRCGFALP